MTIKYNIYDLHYHRHHVLGDEVHVLQVRILWNHREPGRTLHSCPQYHQREGAQPWFLHYTVCPRSSDPLYAVTYDIKWVTTS